MPGMRYLYGSISRDSSDLPPPYTPSASPTSSSQPPPVYQARPGPNECTVPANRLPQYTAQAPMVADRRHSLTRLAAIEERVRSDYDYPDEDVSLSNRC